jgi:hypothetical protein
MKAKEFIPASKPRNFVAKNQQTAGAGAHKDKKKAEKQGDVKHKAKQYEEGVAEGLGKTIKRGMAGWGAFDKDKPADVVKRVKGQDTDTLKGLSNRGSTGKGSPAELQQKAISRELKKRGEQGVAEGGYGDRGFRGVGGARSRENDENDKIDAQIRAQNAQKAQYELSGKFWLKQKDTQQHISDEFVGKAAANAAALELLKQQPELKGNLVITAYGPGESPTA